MPLYLRIFLGFWLVIVLTLSAVVLVNLQLQRDQDAAAEMGQRAQRFAEGMGGRAQAVLDRGGPAALARWARGDQQRHRRITVLVIDDTGSELLGRRVPTRARAVVSNWLSGRALEAPLPGAQVISHPRHGEFLVLLVPPARPLVLRLVGPLGPWGVLAVAAVISGIACLFLARSVTQPIRALRRAGQALGQGRLTTRVDRTLIQRGDELGDLGRDFDDMAARLERLVAGQQQLLRDVSHELRSPLTRLQMALTLVEQARTPEDRQRHLDRTALEIQRLDELIGQILSVSRVRDQAQLAYQPMDLSEMLGDLIDSIGLEADAAGVHLQADLPDRLALSADPEWLRRALENVLRNAVTHSPAGGEIQVRACARAGDPGMVEVTISDEGPGVAADQLEAIFEPFVRLSIERSETGAGGGVGLAIARTAVERHGGTIRAENRPAGGLSVTLALPA
ncbi:HAMP domain-containing sensor histidine kinase [Wenzhouxiangella limi]|uniref:histidine kinase n=1 Tax=Wenzhouxiangella limi TaxID=2707351 RepID=A0A845V472_9GAMM|nr:ATP-binding protein [Wenzhouxiangella limi]NDY94775.1 HAMP domain-containing protein [Wenzhouxiangella limi]